MRFLRAREKWLPKWKGRPKPPPRYFARRYFRRPSGSPSAWVRGVPATAETQRRWPRPMPRIPAFRRSARSVRFIFFAISDSGVRAFECPLSSRTSSFVHGLPLAVFFCATNRCSRRILTRRHLYRGWPARAKRGPNLALSSDAICGKNSRAAASASRHVFIDAARSSGALQPGCAVSAALTLPAISNVGGLRYPRSLQHAPDRCSASIAALGCPPKTAWAPTPLAYRGPVSLLAKLLRIYR